MVSPDFRPESDSAVAASGHTFELLNVDIDMRRWLLQTPLRLRNPDVDDIDGDKYDGGNDEDDEQKDDDDDDDEVSAVSAS